MVQNMHGHKTLILRFLLTHRVDVEHVDGEVVGSEVHGAEELLQRHHLPVTRLAHLKGRRKECHGKEEGSTGGKS